VDAGGVDAVPQVGDELHLRAQVNLNGLSPDDVQVQVVFGRSHEGDELSDVHYLALTPDTNAPAASGGSGALEYAGTVQLGWAGGFGYTVRVVPCNDLLLGAAELGLVAVAS
jgi:starch phosphorylase